MDFRFQRFSVDKVGGADFPFQIILVPFLQNPVDPFMGPVQFLDPPGFQHVLDTVVAHGVGEHPHGVGDLVDHLVAAQFVDGHVECVIPAEDFLEIRFFRETCFF